MEFQEFPNIEGTDYDIHSSSYGENNTSSNINPYSVKLIDLIGFLEDVSEEELQQSYGISMAEYLQPTAETIAKVTQTLANQENQKHR